MKDSQEALLAKRYDEAIRQCDAGIAISPREPAFYTNKAIALHLRSVERYNSSIKLTDERAKSIGIDAAKQDFREAALTATEAVNLLKSMPAWKSLLAGSSYNANKLAAFSTRAEVMRLFASKVDTNQADAALSAIHEYIEIEPDKAKKIKFYMDAARMLLDTGRWNQAVTEYQTILGIDPNNIDATLGVGLALFQSGDKARYKEAAVYLQRFVNQAPDSHPLKASAEESLNYLKQQDATINTR